MIVRQGGANNETWQRPQGSHPDGVRCYLLYLRVYLNKLHIGDCHIFDQSTPRKSTGYGLGGRRILEDGKTTIRDHQQGIYNGRHAQPTNDVIPWHKMSQ